MHKFVGKFFFPLLFIFGLMFYGFSEDAAAQKVRLRAQINPDCTNSGGNPTDSKFADIYADGNIAVQGSFSCRGVFIYDLSNPDAPVLASRYNPGNNIQFLEAVVVGTRGYFGSGNGGGVHIVDLSDLASPQLLGIVNGFNGNGFNSIHEMVVDGNLLYENFNGFSNKIIKVINVSNPANPVFVRDINPTEVNWVHAMHIRGNRLFTSGWGTSTTRGRTEIYDISNIAAQPPTMLGFIEDPTGVTAGNRMHSSWTSEDGNYLYSCRETSTGDGDLRVYDIKNPAQPVLVNSLTMQSLGLNAVTPHNPVVMGNKLYVSWYQAGLQVFDISEPSVPKRIGQYDTFPEVFAQTDAEKRLAADSWDLICGNENVEELLPNTYDGNWAVFPFLGEDKVLAGDLTYGLYVLDLSEINAPLKNRVSDFDGDRKTDYSTFTPGTGGWTIENSSDGSMTERQFGLADDKLAAGDYDGDGRSDIAVWRPSDGIWYIFNSSDSTIDFRQFGLNGDIPVAADYDADGRTDPGIFRPATGVWYLMRSTLGIYIVKWGSSGDLPMAGDFEGDGKADIAVWRPFETVVINGVPTEVDGNWYVLQSSSGQMLAGPFGLRTDRPVTADFDGDGKTEFAVYRPAEGNWYILNSADNSLLIYRFGLAGDLPIPSDFDGDGRADIAVFRPDNQTWYRIDSSDGGFTAKVFGTDGDIPSPESVQP
jgi:hypothetical protein